MSFGIDRAITKLTLKPGERQSRTAFIVQAVGEKLAASKPKKWPQWQSPPAPPAHSKSSFALVPLAVLRVPWSLFHRYRISTKLHHRSAPIRTAASRDYRHSEQYQSRTGPAKVGIFHQGKHLPSGQRREDRQVTGPLPNQPPARSIQ